MCSCLEGTSSHTPGQYQSLPPLMSQKQDSETSPWVCSLSQVSHHLMVPTLADNTHHNSPPLLQSCHWRQELLATKLQPGEMVSSKNIPPWNFPYGLEPYTIALLMAKRYSPSSNWNNCIEQLQTRVTPSHKYKCHLGRCRQTSWLTPTTLQTESSIDFENCLQSVGCSGRWSWSSNSPPSWWYERLSWQHCHPKSLRTVPLSSLNMFN